MKIQNPKSKIQNPKSLLRALGVGVLRTLIFIVRLLPLPMALALGRGMGTLMRWVAKKRYRVALKNLRIAFGETMPQAEMERIARASFRHFGMFVVEGIKFAYMPQSEVERLFHVDPAGFKVFEELMQQKRGCLLISAHLGNFEIMARWLTPRGYELLALARVARDQGTTDLMVSLRERMGIQVVPINRTIKPALAGLKRNACVAIICDQNAADVFVPFFGHPTGTVDGPARIALKMGAPMVFPYCVRDGKGGYLVASEGVYEPIATGDEQADVERTMTEVNRRIEQTIRKYPEQWLWFHDRWRSSPGVSAQPIAGTGDAEDRLVEESARPNA